MSGREARSVGRGSAGVATLFRGGPLQRLLGPSAPRLAREGRSAKECKLGEMGTSGPEKAPGFQLFNLN